jgi:hypothetical protein
MQPSLPSILDPVEHYHRRGRRILERQDHAVLRTR